MKYTSILFVIIIILFSICCILIKKLKQNDKYRLDNIILQKNNNYELP